jgi:hypothetical protein
MLLVGYKILKSLGIMHNAYSDYDNWNVTVENRFQKTQFRVIQGGKR